MRRYLSVIALASLAAGCSGGLPASTPMPAAPAAALGDPAPRAAASRIQRLEDGQLLHVMLRADTADATPPDMVSHGQPNMLYHGGRIQSAPAIYLVLWQFHAAGADPAGEAARMQSFLSNVGGSSWLQTVAQYYQKGGVHIANGSGQLKGTWYDDVDPIPGKASNSSITAEVRAAVAHFGDKTGNADYVIAIPHAHGGFPGGGCAYHTFYYGAAGPTYATTVFAYQPDAGQGCGARSVSGSILDGVTITLGHEIAETETDPFGDAWYDGQGSEIGDKCAWLNLRNTSFGSVSFPTQPLWSNQTGRCVQ